MAAFSGAVKIGDLNDFIAPSQACVVTLSGGKLDGTAADAEAGTVQLQQRPRGGGFSQTLPAAPHEAVKVSLHDCLACSGCVTSAETVLLQHQSIGELQQRLADRTGWTVVVSLSPQSVASLAAVHGLPAAECAARLTAFLRHLGVHAVFDIAAARKLALAEAAAEFVQRYRASSRGAAVLAAAGRSSSLSAARAAADVDAMDVDQAPGVASSQQAFSSDGVASDAGGGPLPMLASACPGWVCYAEKTHGDHVLPHISTGKSPQAVMGTLIKRRWCAAVGLPPERVYHCAVMPCYDKKLEASREDFWLPGTLVPETDCVLATTELQELLEQHGVDLKSFQWQLFDSILPAAAGGAAAAGAGAAAAATAAGNGWHGGDSQQQQQQQQAQQHGTGGSSSGGSGSSGPGSQVPASSGSGGYLEHVFRTAAWELFGQRLPPGPLQMTAGRNADLREVSLSVGGTPVLRFAAAYGFRNIQGLMRKVKLGRCEYDYVEVMACPSGCLNGGGQMKPATGQTTAQLIEQLEILYAGADSSTSSSNEGGGSSSTSSGSGSLATWTDPGAQQLYQDWVQGGPGSAAARQLLHTQYHRREKTVTATLSDW